MKNKKIYVIKSSGQKEEFKPEKLFSSLIRIGVDEKRAEEIVSEVSRNIKNNTSTRDLYKYTLHLLWEKKYPQAHRYALREAIMQLGPEGYPFEQFFAKILRAYGYFTETNKIMRGKCVTHEIDVIAEKDGKRYLIECKYHNEYGIKTDVKVTLYVYARFLDLRKYFDYVWIATNTKLTWEAISYAKCIGMKVTAWRYPFNQGLEKMIENKKLYPITVIPNLDTVIRRRMLQNKIILLKDVINTDSEELSKILEIDKDKAYEIREKAYEILLKEK